MSNLARLFNNSGTRMSPSRSRKPVSNLASRRQALNRAAYALTELKRIQAQHVQITRNLEKAQKEYYKLARRAAIIGNANMKSGRLTPQELARLRTVANMSKTLSTAMRTLRHSSPYLPHNMKEIVAKSTLPH